jgi:uncharacterized short protein YbdD (DUF466 family)
MKQRKLDPIEETIEKIPEYKSFKTVDELDESIFRLRDKYPDLVEVFNAGKTRAGETIYAVKIGKGKLNALLFGCPHPNEPIGTLMLDYLLWRLAEYEDLRNLFNYTFHVVVVADKDGLRLNEGWLKGPFTILNYAMNYYRPAGNKQVEWTFPIKYKNLEFNDPLPETRALMNIIEEKHPDFIYSLHNAGFGGVYYYITAEAPLLYPIYRYYPTLHNVPLALGEAEVPYAKKLSEAIYYMISTPEYYDYLEKHAEKDPSEIIKTGTDSFDYSRKYNPDVFELVTEVPYFYDRRIEDESPTDIKRRKAFLESIEEDKKEYKYRLNIYNKVKDKLKLNTRFQETLEYYLTVFPDAIKAMEKWVKTAEELDRKATVAEAFDVYQVSKFYRILGLGNIRRMLKEEIEAGGDGVLETVLKEVEEEMSRRAEIVEEELEYQVIPIKKLVTIQLAAGLYTMLYLEEKKAR